MEENKEMMTVENENLEPEYEETEEVQKSNGGTFLLLGALLGAGGFALGRWAKKKWNERKAKEPMVNVTDPESVDITPDPVDSNKEETE